MFTLQLFFFNSIYFTFLFLGILFFLQFGEGEISSRRAARYRSNLFSLLPPPSTSCANLELYFCQADRVIFSK